MSDKNQKKGQEQPAEEKVVTRYERRLQKRQEMKEKEQRAKKRDTVIGIVVLAALVCLVVSFPIRNYLTVNGTYIEVGGEKVTQVEYDYQYSQAVNSFLTQYGSMISYFGLDTTQDFSTQMYSEELTWKDFFDQMAVQNLIRVKALIKEAEANGFSYDTSAEYSVFEESVADTAAEEGMSESDFLQSSYGIYATMSRLEPYVKDAILANAYYAEVSDANTPSDDEVQAEYDANVDDYDSVDYRITTINAELPTEPTELADPVEEETDTTESTDETEEETYEPSEAEIAKAMEDAYVLAEAAEDTVATDGELRENVTRSSASTYYNEWLFDSSRQAGDTTIVTNETGNCYYVLSFERRYLDETPSADIRVIFMTETEELTGQSVLDEWTNGAATEESFIELVAKYTEDTSSIADGGLFEGIVPSNLDEALSEWLGDEARAAGDTAAIAASDGYTYVLYYVGGGDPQWKLSIRSSLLSGVMTEYLNGIMDSVQVEDPKGNLNYLAVEASAAAASSAAAETAEEETAATESETEETGTEAAE